MSQSSDEFLENLRVDLANWKREQFDSSVQEDQDVTKLNDYLKLTAFAYQMLKTYLEQKDVSKVDPMLQPILTSLGDINQLSREKKDLAIEYLFRDLIEYPFTYNTRLINSFDETNIVRTNIIPNK